MPNSISLPGSWDLRREFDFKLRNEQANAAYCRRPGDICEAAEELDAGAEDLDAGAEQENPYGYGEFAHVPSDEIKFSAFFTAPYDADINLSDARDGYTVYTGEYARDANGGAGYVILDAGHGGHDPGTVEKGVCETDITLNVVLRAAEYLNEAGVDYLLTRDSDITVPLDKRIELTSPEDRAFLISVHCDWYINDDVNGTSTLYHEDNAESEKLAKLIQSRVTADLGTADRGVHPHKRLILLRESRVPAICVELGFMSNKGDLALMGTDEFADRAAKNITDGIQNALTEMYS